MSSRQAAAGPRRSKAQECSQARILVVEDEIVNRTFLVRLLESLGCLPTAVPDGVEALSVLGQAPFDLVLMDLHLPNLDGLEATRRIRGDASGRIDPGVPIVAVTGRGSAECRAECQEAGMDAYLAKPVSEKALAALIRRVLGPGLHA